ncbi:hypothetical protein PAMA_007909 [Pampus argenteus]
MALNHLRLLCPLLCRSLGRQVRCPVTATTRVPVLCPNTIRYPAACTRLYATKKAKAKAKGQSAKINIKSALVEDIISLDEVNEDMTAVFNALKDDFTRNLSIRTSPGALDHIVVTTQDGKFPLNQLGQISMKSSQFIMVNMSSFPETLLWGHWGQRPALQPLSRVPQDRALTVAQGTSTLHRLPQTHTLTLTLTHTYTTP